LKDTHPGDLAALVMWTQEHRGNAARLRGREFVELSHDVGHAFFLTVARLGNAESDIRLGNGLDAT
jgi:hypothetical protein